MDDGNDAGPGRASAEEPSGQGVAARVETDGLEFVWSYDPATRIHSFDGPDRVVTADDVENLDEAGTALWRYLLSLEGTKYDLPAKQKMMGGDAQCTAR